MPMNPRTRSISVLVVILAAVALVVWRPWTAEPTTAIAPVEHQNSAASASVEAATEPESRREVATDTSAPTPASERALTIRGRAVSRAGEPLADCRARVRWDPQDSERSRPWVDGDVAVDVSTGADGVFEVVLATDGQTNCALRLTREGAAPRTARWTRPKPGEVLDVGDVPMDRAVRVFGTVVDVAGQPVPEVALMFVNTIYDEHRVDIESMLRTESGADGTFEFPGPATFGEWWIAAEYTGPLVEPRSVRLTDEMSEYDLRIVVERPDLERSITGIVVDESGAPIAGARIIGMGEGFIGRGRSGADGRFAAHQAGPINDDGKKGARLSVTAPDQEFDQVEPGPDERFAWGQDGVRVVMQRLAHLDVRVVDKVGRAVEDYALFAFTETGIRYSKQPRGHHPEGRCRLEQLHHGANSLLVVPRDARLASTARLPFVVGPRNAELLVTVPDRVELALTVQLRDGRPAPGSEVDLIQVFGEEEVTATTKLVDVEDCDQRRGRTQLRVAAGRTDAVGVCRLAAPPGSWTVRVMGDVHTPLVQQVAVPPAGTSLRLSVDSAAALHGAVIPAAVREGLRAMEGANAEPMAVVLRPAGESGEKPERVFEVDADGRFRASGLEAGDYEVELRYWLAATEIHSASVRLPVATRSLREGVAEELAIDVAGLLPARVHGQVVVDGQPLGEVHCFVVRADEGPRLSVRTGTDADGRFTATMPPGRYRFAITLNADPGPGWIFMELPEVFELESGADLERSVDVALLQMRIRILDAEGEPVPDQPIRVVRRSYFLPGKQRTDAEGWFTMDPAPPGEFSVSVEIDGAKRTLGPVTPVQGAAVELRYEPK